MPLSHPDASFLLEQQEDGQRRLSVVDCKPSYHVARASLCSVVESRDLQGAWGVRVDAGEVGRSVPVPRHVFAFSC